MGNYDNESLSPCVYPSCTFPEYAEPSERRVYDALAESLPAGWFAWHSLRIRTKPGEFAEGDFLVADPEVLRKEEEFIGKNRERLLKYTGCGEVLKGLGKKRNR